MRPYFVKQLAPRADLEVTVLASKSILNRALLLAALSKGWVRIRCGGYGEDTEAMLACLENLGVRTETDAEGIAVQGCGGRFPVREAVLNVGSAGTVARFLTAALAFCGGTYTMTASEQMSRRPMQFLGELQRAGVSVEFLGEEGCFPFKITSNGLLSRKMTVDTAVSTQYASGILLAAGTSESPFKLKLTGPRTHGSYLALTLSLLSAFHIPYARNDREIEVSPAGEPPAEFTVEPDVSGACYFYALSLLCGARVRVAGVHLDSVQGDIKFLKLLEQKGVRIKDTPEGAVADGRSVPLFHGFDEDLSDFSDQAMTVAALAAYAETPSILRNLSHIRAQECDRVAAILENLNALGARAFTVGDDIFIEPDAVHGGTIKTFGDHRVAMAFSLMGLRTPGIVVDDADCCKKTFPDFFVLLDRLTN